MLSVLVVLNFLFILIATKTNSTKLHFPPDFKFGVATSAYQIEGGWNTDGKGANIFDVVTHRNKSFTSDKTNADIACNSYEKYKEDVQLIKALNVQFYRFSLSWSRILPSGTINNINQAGIQYYNNLIDELLKNEIEPIITLYHWDLPEYFLPFGSWTNPIMVPYFGEYSRLAFRLFGDRVKTWLTFNEPRLICEAFKSTTGINYDDQYPFGTIEYLCAHNLLLAHAEAYHIYNREFRHAQNGRISITIDFVWTEANTSHDEAMAEQRRQFDFGLYANPIFNFDYPKVVRERIANRSRLEGFPVSRLPQFTFDEKVRISGTFDFLGLNHYVTWLGTSAPEVPFNQTSMEIDAGGVRFFDRKWNKTAAWWIFNNAWSYRKLLSWIKKTYNNPEIIVTEIGYADDHKVLDDVERIQYLNDYLNATLFAKLEDGVNVSSFTAWSLMDNFEWTDGYTLKFGLYHVDFSSPNRTRTAKKSASFYRDVVTNRVLP